MYVYAYALTALMILALDPGVGAYVVGANNFGAHGKTPHLCIYAHINLHAHTHTHTLTHTYTHTHTHTHKTLTHTIIFLLSRGNKFVISR